MSLRMTVVAAVVFAVIAAQQYTAAREAREALASVQARTAAEARASVADSLDVESAEIARTIEWLNAFYRSDDGLKRPGGLWIDDHPDAVGIATWVVSDYMGCRLRGRSEAEARRIVEDHIRQTDEWRAKHPTVAAAR